MRRLPFATCVLSSLAILSAACCGESRQRSIASAPPSAPSQAPEPATPHGRVLRGEASYYADFFQGRKTASGERYDGRKLTAANRTLPLGTRVRITRVDTGRSVVVRVNDRGPFGKRRRIFDLSKAAARELDMLHVGRAEVQAVVLD